MGSTAKWNRKLTAPKALRSDHDQARAELARAMMERGSIARAAERVAGLCLPHFEHEENTVFPVLALLPDLERGNLRSEMMDVLPLIVDFRAERDALGNQHQSILAAIEALLRDALKAENREFAEFAYNLRVHEKIEDEVIYPTMDLIGKYLQEKLGS